MSIPRKELPKTPDRNEFGFSKFRSLAPRKRDAKLDELHRPSTFVPPRVSKAAQAAVDEAVLDHQVGIYRM